MAEHVQVSVDFVAEDHASGAIKHLMEGAEKLNEKFEHLSELMLDVTGLGAVIGGAFSFTKAIESTEEHITAVDKLARQTGMASEETDGLLESLNRFGISGEEATGIVGRMSKQMLKLNEASGMGNFRGAAQSMRLLGVDLKQGVVPSLLKLADQTQKGKLNVGALQVGLRVSTETALKLSKALAQGKDAIREQIEEVKNSGTAVRLQDRQMLDRFKLAKNDVTAAVERISLVFGREILPTITRLMEDFGKKIKDWTPAVKEFGKWLGEHLETGIELATTLGKILLTNAVLSKAGLGGITGALSKVGGPLVALIGETATGAAGATALAGAGEMAAATAGIVAGGVALVGVAAALGLVVAGAQALATNYQGVADRQEEAFGRLSAVWGALTDDLSAGFKAITGSGGVADFFRTLLPNALTALTNLATDFLGIIEVIAGTLARIGSVSDLKNLPNIVSEEFAAVNQRIADRVELAKEKDFRKGADDLWASGADNAKNKAGDHYQQFFYPQFDITQTFAEGFEPDRILTAFTHDLAGLGNRGGMSNLTPAAMGGGQGT